MDTGYQALGVFLLVVFILIILLSRPCKAAWHNLSEYTHPLSRRLMVGSVVISMSLVIFVCFIKPAGKIGEPDEVLEYSNTEHLHYQTFWACYTKLQKNRYDMRAHYYLNIAYREVQNSNDLYELREILPSYRIYSFLGYENMADTGKGNDRDLGFFGMGMVRFIYYNDRIACRQYLDSIKRQDWSFVNYLYSLCVDNDSLRIELLKKDVRIEPRAETAEALARVYARAGWTLGMQELVDSDRTTGLVPPYLKMQYAFETARFGAFFVYSIESIFRNSSALSIGGTCFILLLWFCFLYAIDVFEREKTKFILFALFGGMLMVVLAHYLYALFHHCVDYHTNDSVIGDLFYTVLVIGGIEEFVKLVPLLLLLKYTKEVNEPIDYIVFAGLSALGFSVIEDIMYFNSHTVATIYGRAIFTSVSHIADTAIVAYALVVARFRDQKHGFLQVLKGFLIACTVHGLYDFFIINEQVSIRAVPFIILLVEVWWLVHAINNCLNNSPFYSHKIMVDVPMLAVAVSGGLLLLISFVFLHIAIFMSEEYAMMRYFYALMYYFYPLFFFNICIKKIDVFPGHWQKVEWKKIFNPHFFFAGINPKYYLLNGKSVLLTPLGKHTRLQKVFPMRAQILKREKVGEYTGWFRIETERPILVGKVVTNSFLMRAKTDYSPYEHKARNPSYICIEKAMTNDARQLASKDLQHVDWVSVSVL